MRRKNSLVWVMTLVLVMACVVPGVAAPVPTLQPGAVNTFIVQTANAAATRTAQALPSNTPTATFTRTPQGSETPTLTATKSFVFVLPGSTSSLSAPTLAGITNGTSNSKYACNVFSTEPENNTVIAPRTDFTASWGVKNIGKETWYRATMDYVYVSGAKLHEVASYSIPKGAEPGRNVFLTVEMATFKDGGTYTTKWALVVDDIYFCNLTLTIVVN